MEKFPDQRSYYLLLDLNMASSLTQNLIVRSRIFPEEGVDGVPMPIFFQSDKSEKK